MAPTGNTAESLSSTNKFTLGSGTANALAAKGAVTVVGAEATIKGDIRSKGEIVVSGIIEGEVSSDARVTIASGGSVTGKVTAVEIVIEGRLVGDSVASKTLSMLKSANVRGDVTTPVIMIEPGATFVGRCSMVEQGTLAA